MIIVLSGYMASGKSSTGRVLSQRLGCPFIDLDAAIAEFSPREQEVIRMRFVDGMTQAQIAEYLGVSQVQVSRLLRRTLQRMQEKLDPGM